MSLSPWLISSPGAHPILSTTVPVSPPNANCSLHLTLVLPPPVFIDTYDFPFPFPHVFLGHDDLELPVHALRNDSNSWMLISVEEGRLKGLDAVEIAIPLHLRYLQPHAGGGYAQVAMNRPSVFWACPGKASSEVDPVTSLGPFLKSFDSHSIHQIPIAASDSPLIQLRAPVGNIKHLPFVQYGTLFTVLLAFLYLGKVILAATRRPSLNPQRKRLE